MTIANINPNNAPTMTNLNGDSVAWSGVGNTVTLDRGGDAKLDDADLGALNGGFGNWSGASLTVQRADTQVAADMLSFYTSGSLFTVSGNSSSGNLQSGGQTFATYNHIGGVLTINYTSSGTMATTALVNDVARHIMYRNDTPAGDAILRFTLSDGTASTTADVSVTSDTIYVTNLNDTNIIDLSDGVSFSEALAIAAADVTGSQTIAISSALSNQVVFTNFAYTLQEDLTLDLSAAPGVVLRANTLSINGGANLTIVNGAGDTTTLNMALTGAGGIVKSGAGALLTMSGYNGYNGTISVNGGSFLVDGWLETGAVQVSSGATLGGSGNLAGDVTIQSGATLSPGTGTGTGILSIIGSLQMNAGSSLAVQINGTTPGTDYDQVEIYGSVEVAGTTLAVTHGYVPVQGDSYILIVNDMDDTVTGAFSGLPEGAILTASGNGTALTTSYIGDSGNDFTLTATVNAAPVATSSSGATAFTEGANVASIPVAVDSGLVVTDADSSTLASATVAITSNFQSSQDVLAFTNDSATMGNISGSYNSVTGVLTLNSAGASATLVEWQAALRAVTYTNNSDDPNVSTRTVSFVVSDGLSSSSVATKPVNVTKVNDLPIVANPIPDSSATQGTAFSFQFAANSFADVDGDSLTYSATLTGGAALPTWLSFDGATRTFSGMPVSGGPGTISIDVIADDSHGGKVTESFSLVVTRPAPPTTPTTPTDPTPVFVDGLPVTTTPGPGGSTLVTVPVVTSSRPDTPGTPSPLADIPLVTSAGGKSLILVSLPTGTGLQTDGFSTSLVSDEALAALIARIEALPGDNSDLIQGAHTFLASSLPGESLAVQRLTPVAGTGFNPGNALTITGSNAPADGKQAIILDASNLPVGSVIQLNNVDFAAIVGNATLRGGDGQNFVIGDGASQNIILGADDDIIHGGGGNDTVGSRGGNDQIYGDSGDDIVFGGAGNDLLSGGSGSDKLNGGTGFDVALQQGKRSDYSITLDGASIKLTHIASGVSDWLVDVEQVRFDTGPILTVAHSAAEEAAAFLFQKWMGRDLTQSEGAVIQTLDGLSAVQVADLFAQVYPQQAAGKTAQQLLDGMEAAGAIRVDADRSTKYVGDAGDNTFTPTLGMAWTVDGGAGIDTLVFPATLAQTYIDASTTGFTLQRMADGAMLELINVERLTFSDTKLALDLDGHAGQAAKLLGALGGAGLLDNKPLVGEVIRALDAGVSAQSLAQLGLQALGAKTSLEVTQLIWTNVVGSAATQAQLQPFVNLMAQGVTGGELAVLASNLDLNATRIDLVGLAATGIEFA